MNAAMLMLGCMAQSVSGEMDPTSYFDAHWSNMSYQRTCASPQEEASLKGDVMSDSDFKALVASFGLTVDTAEQANCMLNNEKHIVTSTNLKRCVPLMAPGAVGNVSVEERRYGSRGQLPYKVNGTHPSMCKNGMPCKEFNKFLANGSLLALAYECGVAKNLLELMDHPYFYKTSAEAVRMQKSSTGQTDQCYTVVKDQKSGHSFSVRGPVYGPIFYINMAFAYIVGGESYVKQFPACRVNCETPDCQDVPLKPVSQVVQI